MGAVLKKSIHPRFLNKKTNRTLQSAVSISFILYFNKIILIFVSILIIISDEIKLFELFSRYYLVDLAELDAGGMDGVEGLAAGRAALDYLSSYNFSKKIACRFPG